MIIQKFVIGLAIIAASTLLVDGQFPPRLSIPGALSSPARSSQPARVRRPIALRSQAPTPSRIVHDDPKPVTESEEDEQPDAYLPQLLREQQLAQSQQAQFHQAAAAFLNNEPNGNIQETPQIQLLQHIDTQPAPILPAPTRLPERPPPSHAPSGSRLPFNDFGIGRFENTPRFAQERPAPAKPAPLLPQEPLPLSQPIHRVSNPRPRPPPRPEPRQHYEAQEAPARPRPKPAPRPLYNQNQLQEDHQQRPKRPVAQTTRKWREENEDGTITWGYENDDGSFKEEIIGTDCITKGTYGYIDPDGNKREYHYETGIKCDPNARDAEEELDENGYVNYDDNKAVLPNGLEIDMSQLGRKKSKRPGNIYRN